MRGRGGIFRGLASILGDVEILMSFFLIYKPCIFFWGKKKEDEEQRFVRLGGTQTKTLDIEKSQDVESEGRISLAPYYILFTNNETFLS